MHDRTVVRAVVYTLSAVVLGGMIMSAVLSYLKVTDETIKSVTQTAVGSLVTLLTSTRSMPHSDDATSKKVTETIEEETK